jgi:hypothetical protein
VPQTCNKREDGHHELVVDWRFSFVNLFCSVAKRRTCTLSDLVVVFICQTLTPLSCPETKQSNRLDIRLCTKLMTIYTILPRRSWGSHTGGYEEFCLLGHNSGQSVESQPMFRLHLQGQRIITSVKQMASRICRRFGGTCGFHLQGQRIITSVKQIAERCRCFGGTCRLHIHGRRNMSPSLGSKNNNSVFVLFCV